MEPSTKSKKKVKRRRRVRSKNPPESENKEIKEFDPWWIVKEKAKENSQDELTSILLKFRTKQQQYAIPLAPIAVREDADVEQLNTIVYSFLKKADVVEDIPLFEFLINGKLLLKTLGEHLNDLGVSLEQTTEVEYFERYPPPSPKDNLQHDDWVSSVMSSGEWLLTGSYDNTVQLWSVGGLEKGRGRRAHKLTISAHNAPVKAVSWIKNDNETKMFVSGSIDQRAIVWEWNSESNVATCLWECRGHTQSIECLSVAPKEPLFATGSWDNSMKIWCTDASSPDAGVEEVPEIKKPKKSGSRRLKAPLMTFVGHSESISGVDWVDDIHVVSCSWDHSVRLWDVGVGGMTSQVSGNVAFLSLSYSSSNGAALVSCTDRHIRLYDPRAKEGNIVMNKFVSHSKWPSSVRWSKADDNHFVSGGFDECVKVWDKRSSQSSLYDLCGHSDKVMSVDWSCPGHIASGSADCTAQIYDATLASK